MASFSSSHTSSSSRWSSGQGARISFRRPYPGLDIPDSSVLNALNIEFLTTRTNEKEQLQHLNDRFVGYIEKVHSLEQQNQDLTVLVEKLRGGETTNISAVYKEEISKLKSRVESLTNDKNELGIEMDNKLHDLEFRLQKEMFQKEEAESNLAAFRAHVDEATLARLDLERRFETLQEEIAFGKKIHEEEIRNLMSQRQPRGQDQVDKLDLTAALRDIRAQFEDIAAKNISRAEDWYESKLVELGREDCRNKEVLIAAKREISEFQHKNQSMTYEISSLKGSNESLMRQVRDMEDCRGREVENFQSTIVTLRDELAAMKIKVASHVKEYQELLNIKMALDVEIATYRKLLDGEEGRIASPGQSNSRLSIRGTGTEWNFPMEVGSTKTVIKTIETKDGEVVSESTYEQHHQDEEELRPNTDIDV